MASPIEISVVIPTFNEEDRIGRSLTRIREFFDVRYPNYEVLVVNDGSRDRTVPLVREMMAGWPNLRLVDFRNNRGKGFATRFGVLSSRGDWILCSDADLSTPIDEIERLLASGREHAVVIGSRSIRGSKIALRQPLYRRMMGRVFNWAVRALVVRGHCDTQCGFKLYRRDAALSIFDRLTLEGFAFDVEILFLARRLRWSVVEVPVLWLNDDRSKVDAVADPPKMFLDLFRILWRHRRREP